MEKETKEKEKSLLLRTQNLPDVLIDEIYTYLPVKRKIFLNKHFYIYHHNLVRHCIKKGQFENYIRDIVRRDYDFVFLHLLHDHFPRWYYEIKDYEYKNMIFKNYLFFLKEFCLMNDSTKCRNMILDFMEKLDLCKNQHKKNLVRNIRWRSS
jgi:hypothetical protein